MCPHTLFSQAQSQLYIDVCVCTAFPCNPVVKRNRLGALCNMQLHTKRNDMYTKTSKLWKVYSPKNYSRVKIRILLIRNVSMTFTIIYFSKSTLLLPPVFTLNFSLCEKSVHAVVTHIIRTRFIVIANFIGGISKSCNKEWRGNSTKHNLKQDLHFQN